MSFKDFFINGDQSSQPAQKQEVKSTKTVEFPKNDVKFPSTSEKYAPTFPEKKTTSFPENKPTPTFQEKNPYIDKILDVYDKGFTKLNQPGYDFFEFFKAVNKAGIDNPQVYQMALDMGQAMDSNVSRQSLLNQADYYISELEKVHTGFMTDGQSKINELTNKKNSETNSLSSEITSLRQQLEFIQNQIQSKENSLNEIGNKYQPDINEISFKLAANDTAKDTFTSNINKVKSNISNNLK
jgi:polyhydroxyalkanoate synthesis regulator phasin